MQIPRECMALWREAMGSECDALLACLEEAPPVSIRLHPQKGRVLPEYPILVSWCPTGRYLSERPSFTLDPHFHAGAYYVQEASSMFLAQLAPLFREQGVKRVLDVCAAPGGKAGLLAEMLPQDGILVANEVIRSRVGVLCENMAKWGYAHVAITNNDPKDFARMSHYFDAILVDAPCSGEGMFRKEPQAIQEWSPEAVQLCAQRQRRIVADVWEALRPGGYLIYSSCTFNRLENEENVAWMCSRLGASVRPVPIDSDWGIVEQEGCYRFLPHRVQGEGFFFALLQKNGEEPLSRHKPMGAKKAMPLNRQLAPSNWVQEYYSLFAKNELVKALPSALASEMLELEIFLRVVQSGVAVARLKGKDWIPEADLALSQVMRPDAFPAVELDLTTARRYLAREALVIKDAPLGYLLIQYQGSRLGFAKNIGSRINNLYPKSGRIRMDFPNLILPKHSLNFLVVGGLG
ncbi:MAG: rRNA cytosine-C5-methyltransferase [Bacteroidales bacterium]|nr:rRNA cytosine-C5-methyltransferase [Bacteroidales bacterium]